jgi:plasmid stabilization system protein ParE
MQRRDAFSMLKRFMLSRSSIQPGTAAEVLTIVETIAADDESAANAFATRVEHQCALLATTPDMGR